MSCCVCVCPVLQDPDLRVQKHFVISLTCRFCWQLPETDYECTDSTTCMAVACPRQRYMSNCTVRDHIHCLGERGVTDLYRRAKTSPVRQHWPTL